MIVEETRNRICGVCHDFTEIAKTMREEQGPGADVSGVPAAATVFSLYCLLSKMDRQIEATTSAGKALWSLARAAERIADALEAKKG